jgi:alpha-D-xyloside xylohydrolase
MFSMRKYNDGVTFAFDKKLMKIKICGDDIVQVKFTSLNEFSNKNSLVVTNSCEDVPGLR